MPIIGRRSVESRVNFHTHTDDTAITGAWRVLLGWRPSITGIARGKLSPAIGNDHDLPPAGSRSVHMSLRLNAEHRFTHARSTLEEG
jgi:hypothetical protein